MSTPKHLTEATLITFKPTCTNEAPSAIDLARIAATAAGYGVNKDEKTGYWRVSLVTNIGSNLMGPGKVGMIQGEVTSVTVGQNTTKEEVLEYLDNEMMFAVLTPGDTTTNINYDTGEVTFAFKGTEEDFNIFLIG